VGRSGTAFFCIAVISCSAFAGTERSCPSCEHGMARVEGASGAADYLCRFCEVAVHVRPDGREAVSFRLAGERRQFDLLGGARLHFPLPRTQEEAVVPVGEAALAAASGAGHPVRLPGHAVGLPGHPVSVPGAPVNLPSHPVGLPSHPVGLPGHPVELPDHPVERPGHSVRLPSHPVKLAGRPIGLPGHPVGLPGHPVRRPGHPVSFSGTVVIETPPAAAAPTPTPTVKPERPAPAAAPESTPERRRFFGRRDAEARGTAWSSEPKRSPSSWRRSRSPASPSESSS
jgi:hypothetical protein